MAPKILPPLEPGVVDRARALPLWRQVQLELERDIKKGEMAAGERLPTEADLAVRFSVHRHTIRRALDALRDKDLIRVEHGHGIYVRENTIAHAITPNARLSATVRQLSQSADRKVLGSEKVNADLLVSRALNIRNRSLVRQIDLLDFINGVPVSLSAMYFVLPRFSGIEKHITATGSITTSFAKLGVDKYQRKETRLSARLPTREEAELLVQPRSLPIMTILSVDVDDHGVPIAYCQSCVSTRWIELVVRF
ncbi:phosphonate metabolism transcriptional regulator PhnF [Phyllobacterium sophorae]|uniref:Phosphonate metabolism transcriptional regulator PhnF n=1 Tax=Phyllobacterium sophorae TaxID=1520277 RepID=A0A2P7AQI0_9HYPH|nr:phosphonate metabolism transcriptional regulator PhnF [Phyllobacterium sophorae]PSH56486.1 phosphonate metabolism transcriptional regulator PhnF [Phyllobacterium sophorae]